MNLKEKQLWKKIKEFAMDDPISEFSFTERLARENDWSLEYALRAVFEYKKWWCYTMYDGSNEAKIDIKEGERSTLDSKAMTWFSNFFEKLHDLRKALLIRCLKRQLFPSIPLVNSLPILHISARKAFLKLFQLSIAMKS